METLNRKYPILSVFELGRNLWEKRKKINRIKYIIRNMKLYLTINNIKAYNNRRGKIKSIFYKKIPQDSMKLSEIKEKLD